MLIGNVEMSSVALFAIHLHRFQVRKDKLLLTFPTSLVPSFLWLLNPQDEGSTFLPNTGNCLPVDTA